MDLNILTPFHFCTPPILFAGSALIFAHSLNNVMPAHREVPTLTSTSYANPTDPTYSPFHLSQKGPNPVAWFEYLGQHPPIAPQFSS